MRRIHRKRKKNFVVIIILILSTTGLLYSLVNIFIWKKDNQNLKKEISQIEEIVEVEETEDNENTENIPQEEIVEYDPYWDLVKMNLINVKFDELEIINSDTSGWLQVGGTSINYPYVQAKDNSFYLDHSFDKSPNQAGWAFLDYRNNPETFDKNTIIYGHDLMSGAIFGSLKNILNYDWFNNQDNHIVKISTKYENTLWQVFSIYTIPTTSDYLQIEFNSDKEYETFIQKIQRRSKYNFDTKVNSSDKIITLSSCYINSNNKIVLHAKLIKREKKPTY